jgi:ribosomal protein L11 methyltransferase
LVAELGSIGYESFSESDELIEAYIVSPGFSIDSLSHLFPAGFSLFEFSYTYETIPDQNWNEVWEKNYFKPLMVAGRCLIRAPFHTDYPLAEYEILIEPGMAFGTGNHETTSLMISEILEQNLTGKTVLDMGCGTGILSILAAKRGAAEIIGIDIDHWAVDSTIRNSEYNNVTNIEVIQGGSESIPDKKFDFIYANIHRNILLNDMPDYCKALKSGGELIMSGFYSDDLEPVKKRANENSLQFVRLAENDGWVACVFRLK